jgi:lipid-binding SYLF domain-containing protein
MKRAFAWMSVMLLLVAAAASRADSYEDTIKLFKNAGQSAAFFDSAYGWAVFPTIGKGGLIVGAAHGSGRVFAQGQHTGDTTMTQLSVGFQLGGQAYSQIIFFQDRRAYEEFTKGNFEFGADVGAVAITAAAGAGVGTTGASAGASGGRKDATTAGGYYKGMAVFTIVKGGAMYQATVAGQKFTFKPRASTSVPPASPAPASGSPPASSPPPAPNPQPAPNAQPAPNPQATSPPQPPGS